MSYDVCAFKIGWEAPIQRARQLVGNVTTLKPAPPPAPPKNKTEIALTK